MRSSATQPSESTRVAAAHTGSHPSSEENPSWPISRSTLTPLGFTPNTKLVTWS